MDCGRTNNRSDYRTPEKVFEVATRMWGPFELDAAASKDNALCKQYITVEQDALVQPWHGRVWCNPPYGRDIAKWVAKARQEVLCRNAVSVTLLLPCRTDTRWFHDHVWQKAKLVFLRGRLTYGGADAPAPFPSMLVNFSGSRA